MMAVASLAYTLTATASAMTLELRDYEIIGSKVASVGLYRKIRATREKPGTTGFRTFKIVETLAPRISKSFKVNPGDLVTGKERIKHRELEWFIEMGKWTNNKYAPTHFKFKHRFNIDFTEGVKKPLNMRPGTVYLIGLSGPYRRPENRFGVSLQLLLIKK